MSNKSQALRLHPLDNVRVALVDLAAGIHLAQEEIICRQAIPAGVQP